MSDNTTNNNGSNNSNDHNNWLGFSLTPNNNGHMSMDSTSSSQQQQPHHHQYLHEPPSTSSYFLNTSALCGYAVAGNSPFHNSPLSVMPLKSDGSLCIMEALSRSHSHPTTPQGMVSSSSPKLEDFLGGATMSMEAHHYGTHQDREAMMALSLDSIYYPNATDPQTATTGAGKPHSLDLDAHYYSGIALYQTPPPLGDSRDTHLAADQIPQMAGDLKNWVSTHYSNHLHQQMNDHHDGGCNISGSGTAATLSSGDLQSLSLSMSPGSQSSCVTAPRQISPPAGTDCSAPMESKKRGPGKVAQKQPVHRKSIDTFGQRTSQYRGVTRHRWTGRYEAHLWDNSCKKEGQTRKGRQVYLGGYDMEEKAARAYDLAALKYWGPSTHINFPLENYQTELEEMKNMSRQEYVAHLRRKSSGFSRGASMYRGVTRHHQHGRWQARIGRVAGNKDLYLGTFSTQEEAAEAYDVAAIKFRGVNAVTNFDITRYDVERIMASNTLLAGELARRNKDQIVSFNNPMSVHNIVEANAQPESNNVTNTNGSDWKMSLYQSQQQDQSNGCMESVVQKPISSFSMALHDLIGIDSANTSQTMMEESGKLGGGGAHFSDPSSLVTSLSSSREGSPDKSGPAMLFAKPPLASKFVSPATAMSSWFPTAQLRPSAALSMSHFPVFAAWNDT